MHDINNEEWEAFSFGYLIGVRDPIGNQLCVMAIRNGVTEMQRDVQTARSRRMARANDMYRFMMDYVEMSIHEGKCKECQREIVENVAVEHAPACQVREALVILSKA